MGTRFLRYFFEPRSLVVVGPVAEDDATANTIILNLVEAGFRGQLYAVSLDQQRLPEGITGYEALDQLPSTPDLAVVCAPIEKVEDTLSRLGEHDIRAAIVLSGPPREDDPQCYPRILKAALNAGVRVLGPECRGLAVPARRLNATYATTALEHGRVAYLGQSGMLGSAMIDWAAGRGLGLSHLVTLGESIDVRLPDLIDYLNNHQGSARALIVHVEYIFDAMHFMTALREASRRRLVLAIKSGRTSRTETASIAATPGIEHRDRIFDAALARSGVVRVSDSDELFEALEALSRPRARPRGPRLAIIANGLGPAMLALDRLFEQGGKVAEFSETTQALLGVEGLDHSLPGRNPVDLGSDASPQRFVRALEILAADDGVDAILLIHAPTRMAPSLVLAEAVIEFWRHANVTLFTSWMGLATARPARDACHRAGLATHVSPEKAVRAFMLNIEYQQVQSLLYQTPPALAFDTSEMVRQRCHELIDDAHHRGRDRLTHEETAMALSAYGIETAPAIYVQTGEEGRQRFHELDHPVALKAIHRSNCQPFRPDRRPGRPAPDLLQDIETPEAVAEGMQLLAERIENSAPGENIYSFCMQPMQRGKQSLQLAVGISRDAVFGPIILFGLGGYRADVMSDRCIALPPLNMNLAHHLIESSHAARLIREQSPEPERDFERLAILLTRLSQMCTDLPELRCLEINPLLLNRDQLLAVDFALDLGPPAHHAIMPYPEELTECVRLRNGWQVMLRPVRGEDAELIREFHTHLSEESIRYRYFHHKATLSERELAELTQLNYDRQMAFLAEYHSPESEKRMLGISRVWNDPDNIRTEFAIIIRDDLQGLGLGQLLMEKLIAYCRSVGTLEMVGQVRADNRGMRHLVEKLGFRVRLIPEEQMLELSLRLNEPRSDWQRHRLENLND
ncbi:GNAT family N-acetyltransferase [Kushneria phosphatilytica]|uniref:GNAT family N-acetyltransferase n=1 Tax=Kushneria phosphatilytica TaxID=657387 RepID=A0A1S1NVC5_9GAMM|nr:GNAT family N-acetyltransferase [Kushneria phosphatilytica]OHV11911.1 GNAT family N-acetyltransferase [Kushneria phosphatilytica]QEL11088.1 GNAT family N-acetyltransferase [Kushneria phosphatilytica]